MRRSGAAFVVVVACGISTLIAPASLDAGEVRDIGFIIVEDVAVDEMVFSAAIKDRTPITVSDTFPSEIAAVCCYTRIKGAKDSTAIVNSWYHGEAKVVDVSLPVKSPLWRTWSRKTIAPGGRGEWKVDVIAPDGSVIASK